MLNAKLRQSALLPRMIRKAELIAKVHGTTQTREARWRNATLLWPLFNRD